MTRTLMYRLGLVAFAAGVLLIGSIAMSHAQNLDFGENPANYGGSTGTTPPGLTTRDSQDTLPPISGGDVSMLGIAVNPETGLAIDKLGKSALVVQIKNNGNALIRGIVRTSLEGPSYRQIQVNSLGCVWNVNVTNTTRLFAANQSRRGGNAPTVNEPLTSFVSSGNLVTILGNVAAQDCTIDARVIRNHTKLSN